jgi:hypothetical protein
MKTGKLVMDPDSSGHPAPYVSYSAIKPTLTPWSWVPLGKLLVAQLLKTFPTFSGTQRLITLLTASPLILTLSQINPVHDYPN